MFTQFLNQENHLFFGFIERSWENWREYNWVQLFANGRQWMVVTFLEGNKGQVYLNEIANFHINSKF